MQLLLLYSNFFHEINLYQIQTVKTSNTHSIPTKSQENRCNNIESLS